MARSRSIPIIIFIIFIVNLKGYGQLLKVSDNGRYLVYQDDKSFFYLGDTAWELFHRLDRGEADQYLENRAEKGFTVIQAVALAERLQETWFDPRYGVEYVIHTSGTKGFQTYTPPTNGRGNDWILIIEKVD